MTVTALRNTLPTALRSTFLAVLLALMGALSATAADSILLKEIGYNGVYKLGVWTPVQIRITGQSQFSGELVLTTLDGDGVKTNFVTPIQISAVEQTIVERYVKFGRPNSGLTITLRKEGNATHSQFEKTPYARPATQELIVVFNGDAGAKDAIKSRNRRTPEEAKAALAEIKDAAALPDHWCGYEGVHTLLVCTSSLDAITAMTPNQATAIQQWVRHGGRLILSCGKNGDLLFGEESNIADGAFAEMLPGVFRGAGELPKSSGLETFTNATQPLDSVARETNTPLTFVAVEADSSAAVDAMETLGQRKFPAIVRSSYGLGEVTFVAVDLDADPIASWDSRTELMTRMLYPYRGTNESGNARAASRQLLRVGYSDMSGQLRATLDQFTSVGMTSFSLIAGLLAVYVLLIGPADYFFLQKCVGSMRWTWLTFPLIVLAFCGAAAWISASMKGGAQRVNQIDVVDISFHPNGKVDSIRGTTWANVYTPATATFDFTLDASPAADQFHLTNAPQTTLAWQGLPGQGLGAMRSASDSPFRTSYDVANQNGPNAELRHVPIQTSSTKSLVARWTGESELPSLGTVQVPKAGSILRGELTNPFDFALSNCVLFYGQSAYRLKNLDPDETVSLDDRTSSDRSSVRGIEWHLTRKQSDIDGKDIATKWDPAGVDTSRLMELMMLYRAAGGENYTGLTHQHQHDLDFSSHLRHGRAVLICRAEKRAVELVANGNAMNEKYDNSWTFYRFVLPVDIIE